MTSAAPGRGAHLAHRGGNETALLRGGPAVSRLGGVNPFKDQALVAASLLLLLLLPRADM